MPTECERSTTLPAEKTSAEETAQDSAAAATIIQHCGQQDLGSMERDMNGEMSTSTGSTSSSSTTNGHNGTSNGGRKSSITSPDPTAYVAKARVTRPTPPPPSYNPMQFVQIKPCNLYQTAQQQLKKAEEVKKIKEIKKEEPEDWQNNLDNWKSSRRKRVEHIIDRVVEVKKLELEEHDRSRRKSKTFSEMIEERGERGVRVGRAKLASLAVYNEDESNDLSDLGIGTSSASGKSSLSEDYDNNSVMSDNADLDKAIFDNHQAGSCTTREYISSPGYDTSSSTAPASSPDPCEYTYEGAIQDYKQRVSRATSGSSTGFKLNQNVISNSQTKTSSTTSKESTPERINNGAAPAETYPTRRGSKIEERLIGFEVNSPNDSQDLLDRSKVDVPKIDISKRKEIFEGAASNNNKNAAIMELKPQASNGVPKVMLRDRFNLDVATIATDSQATAKNDAKRYSGDISSIKDRLQSLEQQQNLVGSTDGSNRTFATKVVDIPVPPLKVRLSSLQNAATKEDFRKSPVVLVDARQLEIMKDEEENAKMRMKQIKMTTVSDPELAVNPIENKEAEVDRDDSGIHTSDDIEDDRSMEQLLLQQTQDQQLNDAIAALALEEQQLEQAANAVNQIEAEFAELSSTSMPTTVVVATEAPATNEQPCEMEFSVSSTNNIFNVSPNICKTGLSYNENYIGKSAECPSYKVDEVVNKEEVVGNAFDMTSVGQSTCNLRRKPSNEMVHARNLLKMFKETFNNDIDLDEEAEDVLEDTVTSAKNTPIQTQVFLSSTTDTASALKEIAQSQSAQTPPSPKHFHKCPGTPSMIPRSIGPIGKPPMSPKLPRSSPPTRLPQSLPNSPSVTDKPESQFSINGRVEIFNSKNMQKPSKPNNPTSPTIPGKQTHLPHITATTNSKNDQIFTSSHIILSQKHQTPTASEPSVAHNETLAEAKSMPPKSVHVNDPPVMRSPNVVSLACVPPQHQPEVIVCAPAVTVINPDELPKPYTVRALTSCFSNDHGKAPAPAASSKPVPKVRVSKTPPQSPQPTKRNLAMNQSKIKEKNESGNRNYREHTTQPEALYKSDSAQEMLKKLSVISNNSAASSGSFGSTGPYETTAIVHSPPPNTQNIVEAFEDVSTPQISVPSVIPELLICTPNDSSLYKLASSAPPSPASPISPNHPSTNDIAICSSFLSSMVPTGSKSLQTPTAPIRQQTVEELACDKIDVRKLPIHNQIPITGCFEVNSDQVKRCDGHLVSPKLPTTVAQSTKTDSPTSKPNSKPNSPIMAARAAHSKALIDTCEKIIAEERKARTQISCSVPHTPASSQNSTPNLARKSKIPKAIPCCISGSDSMSKADLETQQPSKIEPETGADGGGLLIARLHVVETKIKVTTTTPPASPKVNNKTHPNSNLKKTKNIFDFLKRNFGHQSAEDETNVAASTETADESTDATNVVKVDEIFTIDNSKFYVPSDEIMSNPPPLPLTPAPVNIEISKKITTDEILEELNSEQTLSEEINDLLDDELNKLGLEPAAPDTVEK